MKKILVACAMGVNTSELLAEKIRETLINEEGLNLTVDSSKVNEVHSLESEYDLVVSLADIEGLSIPCVIGVNLLTGIDEESIFEEIKSYL